MRIYLLGEDGMRSPLKIKTARAFASHQDVIDCFRERYEAYRSDYEAQMRPGAPWQRPPESYKRWLSWNYKVYVIELNTDERPKLISMNTFLEDYDEDGRLVPMHPIEDR